MASSLSRLLITWKLPPFHLHVKDVEYFQHRLLLVKQKQIPQLQKLRRDFRAKSTVFSLRLQLQNVDTSMDEDVSTDAWQQIRKLYWSVCVSVLPTDNCIDNLCNLMPAHSF